MQSRKSLEKKPVDLEQGEIKRPETPPFYREIRNSINKHQEELHKLRDMSDDEFEEHLDKNLPKDLHRHIKGLRGAEREKLAKEVFGDDFGENQEIIKYM